MSFYRVQSHLLIGMFFEFSTYLSFLDPRWLISSPSAAIEMPQSFGAHPIHQLLVNTTPSATTTVPRALETIPTMPVAHQPARLSELLRPQALRSQLTLLNTSPILPYIIYQRPNFYNIWKASKLKLKHFLSTDG